MNMLKVSFCNQGIINHALSILITAAYKDADGIESHEKYRIFSWKSNNISYFNIDSLVSTLQIPHSKLFICTESVFFDDENKMSHFSSRTLAQDFYSLPGYIKDYLRDNLYFIMKEAPNTTAY